MQSYIVFVAAKWYDIIDKVSKKALCAPCATQTSSFRRSVEVAMLNKNVCPRCGQLYDLQLENCPLCGEPAPKSDYEPVHRRRITEEERRQRRVEKRLAEKEEKRRLRAEKKAAAEEEERYLQQQEELERQQRRQRRRGGVPQEDGTPEMRREPPKPQSASAGPTPRPAASTASRCRPADTQPPREAEEPTRTAIPVGFKVVSVVFLLLALGIGGSYLLWRGGVIRSRLYETLSVRNAADKEDEGTDVGCKGIVLNVDNLIFDQEGETLQLAAMPVPNDCKEPVSFSSSNPAVVTVAEDGIVTAITGGEAYITVRCGNATAMCRVDCRMEEPTTQTEYDPGEPLELSSEDITFFNPGEHTTLEVTNVPAGTDVIWSSEDESVAKVSDNGYVEAVSAGTVTITAKVGQSTGTCIVRCNFSQDDG